MAEQRIPGRDGTTTIISDSFAPYGSIPGTPTPVEDPSKWREQTLSEAEVLARYRWTPEQLVVAREHGGFPWGELKTDATLRFGISVFFKGTPRRETRAADLDNYDQAMTALGYRR